MSKCRDRRYYSGFKKSMWWHDKRDRLYWERGGICEGCNEKKDISDLTVHHIVPRSKRGRDVDANIILLCDCCHADRHKDERER